MGSKKMAIVCEGKEISYGLNLLHLLQYKSDKEIFLSEVGSVISAEIYSVAAFKHANISKKTLKVFVGNIQSVASSYSKVFSQYGMNIFISEAGFILRVDNKKLSEAEYDNFILYANKRRKEYFDLEKKYMDRVEIMDSKWVAKVFDKTYSEGLFGIKNASKSITRQQYDCLAFVLYLDHLAKKEM